MNSTSLTRMNKEKALPRLPYSPGRPILAKTIEAQKMREQIAKMLRPKMRALFGALYESAMGLRMVKETADGTEFVYSKAPDTNAARLLMEYGIGKPKEQIEHSGNVSMFHLVSSLENNHGDSG